MNTLMKINNVSINNQNNKFQGALMSYILQIYGKTKQNQKNT